MSLVEEEKTELPFFKEKIEAQVFHLTWDSLVNMSVVYLHPYRPPLFFDATNKSKYQVLACLNIMIFNGLPLLIWLWLKVEE